MIKWAGHVAYTEGLVGLKGWDHLGDLGVEGG